MPRRLPLQCLDEVLVSRRFLEFGEVPTLPADHNNRHYKDDDPDEDDKKTHIPSFQTGCVKD